MGEDDVSPKDQYQLSNYGGTRLAVAGGISGLLQAVTFHPFDRALYLSIKDRTPLFHSLNWRHPTQGLLQTIWQRAASSGLYFPLESTCVRLLDELSHTSSSQRGDTAAPTSTRYHHNTLGGLSAGLVNAVILHPFAALKYAAWATASTKRELSSWQIATWMLKEGGSVQVFFRGGGATIMRDAVFGAVFSGMRHPTILEKHIDSAQSSRRVNEGVEIPDLVSHSAQFVAVNAVAAMTAVVASSPFNFIRNIIFSTPPGQTPPRNIDILKILLKESSVPSSHPRATTISHQLMCVRRVCLRLQLGWGIVRVSAGMTCGALIYEAVRAQLLRL